MNKRDRFAALVLDGYRDRGLRVRLHTRLRWFTAPFDELDAALPRRGRILDVGCGHGVLALYLAASATQRTVHGVDIDAAKIAHATAAATATGLADRVTFEHVDADHLPQPGSIDAAVVSDVLYVLGPARVAALLDSLADALVEGGAVVVEETDLTPRWWFRLARLQEWLSVHVFHLTEAELIDFVAPEVVAARLSAAGLDVSLTRLDRRRLHPQFVVVGRRPDVSAPSAQSADRPS